MEPRCFVMKPEQRDRPLNVVGTEVTILASNDATQGMGVTLQQGDEGNGPPPHYHAWEEAFYVLKGSVNFTCEGKPYNCPAGTFVYVPAGTVHGFQYGAGGGQMLEFTGTGSLAAQMFTAMNKEIPPGAPDIPRIIEVLGRNGVNVAA